MVMVFLISLITIKLCFTQQLQLALQFFEDYALYITNPMLFIFLNLILFISSFKKPTQTCWGRGTFPEFPPCVNQIPLFFCPQKQKHSRINILWDVPFEISNSLLLYIELLIFKLVISIWTISNAFADWIVHIDLG